MKKAVESTFIFFAKNIAYIVLSIGYPLWFLYNNYNLYETYNVVTKLKMAGIIGLVIILFFGKGYLSTFVYAMKIDGWQGHIKKFLWGVFRMLPFMGAFVVVMSISVYGELVQEVLGITILTNLFAFNFAPNNVIRKKNITG